MIAIKRLQSIMWILVVAMGALSAYLISLRVATERNAVWAMERQIYATRANIRYLELEFGSRASMRQLEAWNTQDIRYSVPTASQYLGSEQQLAALDRISPTGKPYVAPPVMAAMAEAQPIPVAPAPVPAAPIQVKADVAEAAPAPAPVKAAVVRSVPQSPFPMLKVAASNADAPPRVRAVALSLARPDSAPRIVKLADHADPAQRRATRLALLDQKLLDTSTLRRIDQETKR